MSPTTCSSRTFRQTQFTLTHIYPSYRFSQHHVAQATTHSHTASHTNTHTLTSRSILQDKKRGVVLRPPSSVFLLHWKRPFESHTNIHSIVYTYLRSQHRRRILPSFCYIYICTHINTQTHKHTPKLLLKSIKSRWTILPSSSL